MGQKLSSTKEQQQVHPNKMQDMTPPRPGTTETRGDQPTLDKLAMLPSSKFGDKPEPAYARACIESLPQPSFFCETARQEIKPEGKNDEMFVAEETAAEAEADEAIIAYKAKAPWAFVEITACGGVGIDFTGGGSTTMDARATMKELENLDEPLLTSSTQISLDRPHAEGGVFLPSTRFNSKDVATSSGPVTAVPTPLSQSTSSAPPPPKYLKPAPQYTPSVPQTQDLNNPGPSRYPATTITTGPCPLGVRMTTQGGRRGFHPQILPLTHEPPTPSGSVARPVPGLQNPKNPASNRTPAPTITTGPCPMGVMTTTQGGQQTSHSQPPPPRPLPPAPSGSGESLGMEKGTYQGKSQSVRRNFEDPRDQALKDNMKWSQQKQLLQKLEEEMLEKQIHIYNIKVQVSALQLRNFLEDRFPFLRVEQVMIETEPTSSTRESKIPPHILRLALQKGDKRHKGSAIVQLQSKQQREQLLPQLGEALLVVSNEVAAGRECRLKISRYHTFKKGQFHRKSGGTYNFRMRSLEVGSIMQDPISQVPMRIFVREAELRGSSLEFSIDLVGRCLVLSFWASSTRYKLEVRFKHICDYLTLQSDGSILLTLRMPPRLHKYRIRPRMWTGRTVLSLKDMCKFSEEVEETFLESSSSLQDHSEVVGAPSFRPSPDSGYEDPFEWPAGPGAREGNGLPKDDQNVLWLRTRDSTPRQMMASCLSYRLMLGEVFLVDESFIGRLQDFGLLPRHNQIHQALQVRTPDTAMLDWVDQQLSTLPLPVWYHLMVLLTWKVVVNRRQLDERLLSMLRAYSPVVCVKALSKLADAMQPIENLHLELAPLLMEYGEEVKPAPTGRYGQLLPHTILPPNCADVVRLLVTPMRVCVLEPEVERSNRVVRTFTNPKTLPPGFPLLSGADFARVSVGDENGSQLYGMGAEHSEIWVTLCKQLNEGIHILGRHYVFLAYSSSQLKDCSLWMVADQQAAGSSQSLADRIRAWMGDFMSRIKIVAKCAARMGQCFSITAPTVGVKQSEEAEIPDIEVGPYCFSDGCGEISRELLLDVLKKVPFGPRNKQDVTAIQVRFRGCKGVLSLNDRLPGRQLLYRPSMEKFGSEHRDLEVCSLATFTPCYLNRHVILLMVSNGLSRDVIVQRQADAIAKLDAMVEDGRVACELLPRLGAVNPAVVSMLTTMMKGGISPRAEPFLHRCLAAVRRQQLMDMKHKCRILVPQGAVLMGSIDQTGDLGPDELFLQVREDVTKHDSPWVVITGPVLIAKHPVMHPGDVRVYTAVDAPALHGNKNELKFPRVGKRPIPNQLSGSDLDGDLYAVVWDPELFPPGPNKEPMDYTAPKPQEVAQVQVSDILDHFVNHALNDNLGRIANSWLVHADISVRKEGSDEGCAANWTCLRLAELHSIAVDFPKTGVPAQMDRSLLAKEMPHWMESKNRESYKSASVLGKLYDAVVGHEALVGRTESDLGWEMGSGDKSGWPADLRVEGWEAWAEVARKEQNLYYRDMAELMNRYHVHFEGELLTGCVLKFHRYHKEQHHEVKEQLMRQARAMSHHARMRILRTLVSRTQPERRSEKKLGSKSGDTQAIPLGDIQKLVERKMPQLQVPLHQLVCACYRATYFPDEDITAPKDDDSEASDGNETEGGTAATSETEPLSTARAQPSVQVDRPETDKWRLYSFPWVVVSDYLVPLIRDQQRKLQKPSSDSAADKPPKSGG